MEFQTLYFDLTNEEDVKTITSSSIHDLLLSQETEESTGATSPFYIILNKSDSFICFDFAFLKTSGDLYCNFNF